MDAWFSNTKYNKVEVIKDGGWHFSNLKSPENIQKKLLNFGHHNEVEESGPDLNKIRKMVQEKKVYFDHLADKTQEKKREEGYPLKRMDLSELPTYLKKNFNTFNEWFDN
jgi:hypothetical protein